MSVMRIGVFMDIHTIVAVRAWLYGFLENEL